MSTQTYLLIAAVAILCAVLVLVLMQPRKRKAGHSYGTMTIDLECDAGQAMAELRKVTAALERIAHLQAKTNTQGLQVRTYDEAPPHKPKRPEPPPSRLVRESEIPARPKHRTPEKPKRR